MKPKVIGLPKKKDPKTICLDCRKRLSAAHRRAERRLCDDCWKKPMTFLHLKILLGGIKDWALLKYPVKVKMKNGKVVELTDFYFTDEVCLLEE